MKQKWHWKTKLVVNLTIKILASLLHQERPYITNGALNTNLNHHTDTKFNSFYPATLSSSCKIKYMELQEIETYDSRTWTKLRQKQERLTQLHMSSQHRHIHSYVIEFEFVHWRDETSKILSKMIEMWQDLLDKRIKFLYLMHFREV